MPHLLFTDADALASLCRRHRIRRLSVFWLDTEGHGAIRQRCGLTGGVRAGRQAGSADNGQDRAGFIVAAGEGGGWTCERRRT